MIVIDEPESWLLIRQPDHAALSERLMAAWVADGFPDRPRRDEILAATGAHDDGWIELELDPAWDPERARPYDFLTEPEERRHGLWPRAVDLVGRAHGPYAASLVARHAAYLSGVEAGPDTLDRDYAIVRDGDLLSLVACGAWGESTTMGGRRVRRVEGGLEVAPDPFGGARVPYRVPCRRIERRDYGSDEALREAIDAAAWTHLPGVAGGSA